ncbi:actin [Porphyridium purpureum]|uniref:Actin n=1 Tax=Porphyridium purpureum TaxID=35688 RepID=A0A5J4YRV0_PORPP|nr:actin [Porphyridium purpureum]|eukprot:POR4606..scf229_5
MSGGPPSGYAAAAPAGGVDAGVIVVDAGSYYTRIGLAGDDVPRLFPRSCVGERTDHSRAAASHSNGAASNAGGAEYVYGDEIWMQSDALHDIRALDPMDSEGLCALLAAQCAENKVDFELANKPLIMVEPSVYWDQDRRYNLVEIMFEQLDLPATFILRGAVGAAFSGARGTALVLDIGHQAAVATPVLDGYSLLKNTIQAPHLGGRAMSEEIANALLRKLDPHNAQSGARMDTTPSVPLPSSSGPQHANEDDRVAKRAKVHESEDTQSKLEPAPQAISSTLPHESSRAHSASLFGGAAFHDLGKVIRMKESARDIGRTEGWRSFMRQRMVDDIKMHVLRVPMDVVAAPGTGEPGLGSERDAVAAQDAANGIQYELPDGQVVTFSAAECDMAGQHLFQRAGDGGASTPLSSANGVHGMGLHEISHVAMRECDVDARRELAMGVIVCGGGSQIPGLFTRLQKELAILTPQMYKLRMLPPTIGVSGIEKASAAWIGGSILGSLGTFQQMWLSAQEYAEIGHNAVDRRFS